MRKRNNTTRKIVPASFGKYKVEVKEIRLLRKVRGRWSLVNDDKVSVIPATHQRLAWVKDTVVIKEAESGLPQLLPLSRFDKKNCA